MEDLRRLGEHLHGHVVCAGVGCAGTRPAIVSGSPQAIKRVDEPVAAAAGDVVEA